MQALCAKRHKGYRWTTVWLTCVFLCLAPYFLVSFVLSSDWFLTSFGFWDGRCILLTMIIGQSLKFYKLWSRSALEHSYVLLIIFAICISGPVANTFGDFWRTVWDQGVCVIVMVTNIVEGGRVGNTTNFSNASLITRSIYVAWKNSCLQHQQWSPPPPTTMTKTTTAITPKWFTYLP